MLAFDVLICIATCFRFFLLLGWNWDDGCGDYFSRGAAKADFYLILIKDRFPLPFGSVLYGGNPMGLLSLGPAFLNASYLYLLCKTSCFKIHIVFETILNCMFLKVLLLGPILTALRSLCILVSSDSDHHYVPCSWENMKPIDLSYSDICPLQCCSKYVSWTNSCLGRSVRTV